MVCCPIPLHFYNPDVQGPLIIVIPVTLLKLLLIFNKMGQMTLKTYNNFCEKKKKPLSSNVF